MTEMTELELRLCFRHVWTDEDKAQVIAIGRSIWRERIIDAEASLACGSYCYTPGALHCCDPRGYHAEEHERTLNLDRDEVNRRFTVNRQSVARAFYAVVDGQRGTAP